jgi:hypothetical protein
MREREREKERDQTNPSPNHQQSLSLSQHQIPTFLLLLLLLLLLSLSLRLIHSPTPFATICISQDWLSLFHKRTHWKELSLTHRQQEKEKEKERKKEKKRTQNILSVLRAKMHLKLIEFRVIGEMRKRGSVWGKRGREGERERGGERAPRNPDAPVRKISTLFPHDGLNGITRLIVKKNQHFSQTIWERDREGR